jgi:hypothetical protein
MCVCVCVCREALLLRMLEKENTQATSYVTEELLIQKYMQSIVET